MNNKVPVIIAAIVIIAGALFFVMQRGGTPLLKQAKHSEAVGNRQKACALYAEAVYTFTPAITVPDIIHSKFAAPDIYRKETEKYLADLTGNNIGKKPEVTAATAGLIRCNDDNQTTVRLTPPKVQQITMESYISEWKKSFFAPEAKADPSQVALAEGNHERNLSLLVISCGVNYSYECMLLNKATLQATKFLIPAENSARLYAFPGEYYLITRSTVSFPGAEIWRSDYIALPISIPAAASLVTTELRTRLPRRDR